MVDFYREDIEFAINSGRRAEDLRQRDVLREARRIEEDRALRILAWVAAICLMLLPSVVLAVVK